jgi:hypothetical protein
MSREPEITELQDARRALPRRWPISDASEVILEAANDALAAAQAVFNAAQQTHQSRVFRAAKIDGVPVDEVENAGLRREGDEWVEVVA